VGGSASAESLFFAPMKMMAILDHPDLMPDLIQPE